MHHLLWCCSTIYICANSTCHQHHRTKINQWYRITAENLHVHQPHHYPIGILPDQYKLCIPGAILSVDGRCSHGKSTQSHSGKHLHGEIWKRSLRHSSTSPKSVEKICWWHFCHPRRAVQRRIFSTHKFNRPNITFTAETTKADGSMPFYDTLVTPQCDGSLVTTVYRKPTHTNQYLQSDSHHAITNKYSIISSLLHRAKHICSNQQLLEEEQSHIQGALSICKYPNWAINRTKLKMSSPKSNRNNNSRTISRGHLIVSYSEGLHETVKNICKRYGIQVHFKSGKSIKNELVVPKDKDHLTKKSGIIYRYKCDR